MHICKASIWLAKYFEKDAAMRTYEAVMNTPNNFNYFILFHYLKYIEISFYKHASNNKNYSHIFNF